MRLIARSLTVFVLFISMLCSCGRNSREKIHVFEIKEIVLKASEQYDNPYTKVECWVELKGPDFSKKIYGFWNGGNEFVFRVAATTPATWTWQSASNQHVQGLNGHTGSFTAV